MASSFFRIWSSGGFLFAGVAGPFAGAALGEVGAHEVHGADVDDFGVVCGGAGGDAFWSGGGDDGGEALDDFFVAKLFGAGAGFGVFALGAGVGSSGFSAGAAGGDGAVEVCL